MTEAQLTVKSLWERQLRQTPLWIPVGLAIGVLLRLSEWWLGLGSLALLAIAVGALRIPSMLARLLCIGAIASICLGAAAMELRLRTVDAPILSERFEGSISGRVLLIERTSRGSPRMLLDKIEMSGVARPVTPERVRIVLLDEATTVLPEIGARIVVSAILSRPPGPAEPGAFDFSRQAWFARIGAVGFTRDSIVVQRRPENSDAGTVWLNRLRRQIAFGLADRLDPEIAGIAAALTIGDRSAIPRHVTESLRDSGLAHLLAISGLHMGLLSSLVYAATRLLLSLHPLSGERIAHRKIAAVAALVFGAAYLLLSGGGIATQRAFVMVAVALIAIMFDRSAVTLRGLAAAACVILLVRPEALFSAGFQMSFAAVAALVASYEVTRSFWRRRAKLYGWRSWLLTALLASVMTSFVAGLATSPFGAFHFNRLVLFGLAANLLAMPIMAFVIMPMIVVLPIFALVGVEVIPLAILELGLACVLAVSNYVAALPDGVRGVAAVSRDVLTLIVLGGLWLFIWRGALRLVGLVPLILALLLWTAPVRPDLLVRSDGALTAGRTDAGALWISDERRARYTSETWLRRDGDMPPNRIRAYAQRRWSCGKTSCAGRSGDWDIRYLRVDGAVIDCTATTLLVVSPDIASHPERSGCHTLRLSNYDGSSAIAVYLNDNGKPPLIKAAYPWQPPI